MDKKRLEHLSCKMIEFMSKNRNKTYNQVDIMEVCKVNIVEAIEISDFLTKIGACNYNPE